MQKGKEGEEAEKHRGGSSAPPVAWVPPCPRQGPLLLGKARKISEPRNGGGCRWGGSGQVAQPSPGRRCWRSGCVLPAGQAGRPGLLSPGPRLAFPPCPGPVPKGAWSAALGAIWRGWAGTMEQPLGPYWTLPLSQVTPWALIGQVHLVP